MKLLKPILLTGLLVGTLDALAAILNFIIPTFRNPIRIFQYIASGFFGRDVAFSNELLMPLMGLIFHYIIATSWTALFFLIYPKLKWIGQNRIASGLIYGAIIWIGMNELILPLSRVSTFPFQLKGAAIGMVILMFAVGLPVSFRTHQYYSGKA